MCSSGENYCCGTLQGVFQGEVGSIYVVTTQIVLNLLKYIWLDVFNETHIHGKQTPTTSAVDWAGAGLSQIGNANYIWHSIGSTPSMNEEGR